MKPCAHAKYNENCRICWLERHKPKYRRLWKSRLSVEQLAEAKK